MNESKLRKKQRDDEPAVLKRKCEWLVNHADPEL
jgi:hypothetical protein